MMNRRHSILLLSASLALAAQAQELHESLNVEGEYIPEVIRQDKIYTFPTVMQPEKSSASLPAATQGVVSAYSPELFAMPPLGWETRRLPDPRRGYLTFAAGSQLNVLGNAGYRIIDTESTSLSAMLRHNSTSLFHARPRGIYHDTYRRRYDETIGLKASHTFGGAGTLDAELWYRLAWFNYYGIEATDPLTFPAKAPTQTLNDAGLRIGWNSAAGKPLAYRVGVAYRYFGYRDYITENLTALTGRRENNFRLDGDIAYSFTDNSALALSLDAHLASYNKIESLPDLDTYSIISLTPQYRLQSGSLRLSAGPRIDIAANAGMKGDRYSAFHIAPEVNVDWRGGDIALFLHARGGSSPFTLAANSNIDYYQMPDLISTDPVFSPLDLKAGVTFGPVKGFSGSIHAAYKIADNTRAGGWYMARISPAFALQKVPEGFSAIPGEGRYKLSGFSFGADFRIEAGKFVEISAAGTYQPQNGDKGYFNGYDRPRWTADASLRVKPADGISIDLTYSYRGVRRIYTQATSLNAPALHTPETRLIGHHLPDITDLSLGAMWNITDSFSVNILARNLLCRRVQYLPLVREEGLSLLAGFGVAF